MSEFGPYSNENGSSGLVGCVNEMAQRDRLSVEKLTHVIEELVREESQDEDSEGFSHSTDNQSRISLNTDENGRNSLTHSRFSLLTDIRWRNASIEPYRIVKADTVEVFDELPAWCIRCSSCATVLNGNRAELLAHYQSDWHQLNSLRAFNGCAPLSEDKIGDNLQFSEFYDISDAPLLKVLSSKKNVYFLHEKYVYSIYRCILHPNEQISDSVFRRPLDCAIIMLTAGHFAGAIFKCSEMIEHKTFHRYVVRAKQGARQSKADSRQSSARSVGAQLRRSNEKLLKEEIKKTVTKWSDLIDETPLIFIRCAESDKSFFTSDHSNGSLFLKSDQRIRTIPFVTYRADLHEVRRIWRQLQRVYHHGTFSDFYNNFSMQNVSEERISEERISKLSKISKNLSISHDDMDLVADIHSVSSSERHKTSDLGIIIIDKNKSSMPDDSPKISEIEMKLLYTAVRFNSVDQLNAVLENISPQQILQITFPPDGQSLLHVAVHWMSKDVLQKIWSNISRLF